MKFYQCKTCGKIAVMTEKGKLAANPVKNPATGELLTAYTKAEEPEICCGAEMEELIPNTVDAAKEKHVPVVTREGQTVTVAVGSVAHPMQEEHYIGWILLETKNGEERKELKPGDEPIAQFYTAEDDEIVAAYAYCNLHGLWQS